VDRLAAQCSQRGSKADAAAEGYCTGRAELRRWFDHDPAHFAEFSRRYRAKLTVNKDAVTRMDNLLKAGPVTLLCAAHDTEHNHARVLADYLRARA
jgi:uncharacterized protein YeaO (DUF488 family)